MSQDLERIFDEQVRTLSVTAAIALNTALFGALVLCAGLLYIGAQSPRVVSLWFAAVAADYLLRQALCRAYRQADRARAAPDAAQHGTAWSAYSRRWARVFTLATLAGGLVWGCGAVAMMTGDDTAQLFIMLFISATASGAVPAFGSHLPTTYAYTLSAMLPYVLWCALQGDALHHALVVMGIVFSAVFLALAHRAHANLLDALRLRFENLDLARDLERGKRVAEEANQAKSRFLAAASHDLRQPVHALGMFVGALRGRTMDAESARLVDHVNGSVESLDQLFTAMLDISRLDAGVVATRGQTFLVQPLLQRVCAELAPQARAKGLVLRLHDCALAVETDPIPVERIVRNLVSNAIRYTGRGRVVVGCRRHGATLRIEVHDTGRGIAADQHDKIFEEFYQIDNAERDRAKGLGLGLAISRRLSELIRCPLSVASTPGRGSVFALGVPISDAPVSLEPHAVDAPPATALGSRLVLVIDDEAPIREAMRSLLPEWGYDVMVAASCAQMLAQLADCPTRPALIISDYRLREAATGIEAIERLRQEFNHDIPAMLITGDTGPDRLQEAMASGYLLLHKPVPRGRLRAAIRNLVDTGAREDATLA